MWSINKVESMIFRLKQVGVTTDSESLILKILKQTDEFCRHEEFINIIKQGDFFGVFFKLKRTSRLKQIFVVNNHHHNIAKIKLVFKAFHFRSIDTEVFIRHLK